jgi:8-oxo-dGTP diphosphatase
MNNDRPRVGIGILLVKQGKILLGQRKGSHGAGEYSLPGGHLEAGESFEDCVLRELAEEVGSQIKIKNVRFLCVTNLRKYMPKHYVDIGMAADWVSGEPKQMEPEKNSGWAWYDIDNLPSPLFGCTENYLESLQTGLAYFAE